MHSDSFSEKWYRPIPKGMYPFNSRPQSGSQYQEQYCGIIVAPPMEKIGVWFLKTSSEKYILSADCSALVKTSNYKYCAFWHGQWYWIGRLESILTRVATNTNVITTLQNTTLGETGINNGTHQLRMTRGLIYKTALKIGKKNPEYLIAIKDIVFHSP